MGSSLLLLLPLFLIFAWLWLWQFITLMLLEDELFPGKYDKLIWGLAFALMAPLTPIAFLVWKSAYREQKKRDNN